MSETETAEAERAHVPDDLESMTVPALRELAAKASLEVPKSAPKATLIEALEEYRARVADEDDPGEIEGEVAEETDEPSTELAVRDGEAKVLAERETPPAQTPAILPTTAEFDAMLAVAGRIASTQMVPVAYRGKPDDVLAAFLTGREMGLGLMQSLRDIYVVDGKPTLSAGLLLARLREGGVVIVESTSTAEVARIKARRRDTGEVAEVEWTHAEAERVTSKGKKLTDKDNWRNYPADMLWARCVGRLARRLGSDLIGSVLPYTSEEVQDWDDESADGNGGAFGSDKRTGQWIGPRDWKEAFARIAEQVGGEEALAWMGELAKAAYAQPTLGDVIRDQQVDADRKADLWKRLVAIVRGLEEAAEKQPVSGVGLQMTVGAREIIAKIIYDAFGQAVMLTGPQWALDPEEAERLPSKEQALGLAPATAEASEAAPQPEGAPESDATQAGDDADAAGGEESESAEDGAEYPAGDTPVEDIDF